MDDDVSLAMVRLWCEALEDANPVYHSDESARRAGFSGIIAPPPMVLTWCLPAEWRPVGGNQPMADQFRVENPQYPHSLGLGSRQRHSRPLRIGERLTVRESVGAAGPPTQTARGFGPTQTRRMSLHEPSGQEVARIEFDTVRLADVDAGPPTEHPLAALSRAGDGEIADPWSAGPGSPLPSLSLPVTLKRCMKWVAASRDFYEVHHDREYARSTGARDLYIGVHFFQGLVGRFLTDWTGPGGILRAMDFEQYGRCYPGETATVVGKVRSRRRNGGTLLLDLDVSAGCERGRLYSARVAAEVWR